MAGDGVDDVLIKEEEKEKTNYCIDVDDCLSGIFT
jgi:hypothetical protein